MRVWRAALEEAPAVAALLGGFRDHLGYDHPSDASMLASVERLIGREDAEDCWLEDLYVRPEARGSGLGRTLTQAVIDRATARGCRRVELDASTENPAAIALYQSLGFDTGKTGGQDLFMRRRL